MSKLIIPQAIAAGLHPDLKKHVAALERHGFTIMDHQLVVERSLCTGFQLDLLTQACRQSSKDADRDLIIKTVAELVETMPEAAHWLANATQETYHDADLVIMFDRRRGGQGTLPEPYVEDTDGEGVVEQAGQPLSTERH